MYTTSLTLALVPGERREGKVPEQVGAANGFVAVDSEEGVDVITSADVGDGIVAVAIGSLVTWVPVDDSVGIGLIVGGAVALGWAGMFVVSAIAVCVNPIEICTASAASWDSWRELI